MDDFGTGYSSLSYLSRFPVDILKMDRSFLAPAHRRRRLGLAARSSALGATLDLEVVAEGIELPEQIDTLRELGCDARPGLLLRPPDGADATLDSSAAARRRARRRATPPASCSIATRRSTAPAASPGSTSWRRSRTATSGVLWAGMTVSLVGDGIFLVAIAWQVYELSNAPTALSLVGIAMTIPTIVLPAAGRRGERPLRPAPRDALAPTSCAASRSRRWPCSR